MSKSTSSVTRGISSSLTLSLGGLILGLLILLLCLVFSITFGAVDIHFDKILTAFTSFDDSKEHLIIRTVRLPRSLLAIIVGTAMSTAGAIMQGITHNPLADLGILGVNAGAAFAVVIAIFALGASSPTIYIWYALVSAGISVVSVYTLASLGRSGVTPLNLIIVADCALYTEANIRLMSNIKWLSRVPLTLK